MSVPVGTQPQFAQSRGWALRIEISNGKKFFLLQPPGSEKTARLTSKQIASRQATREQLVEQCNSYIEDEHLDNLFGLTRRGILIEEAELPSLMNQAAKLFEEEAARS